jgi:hypothetical protein
VNILNRDDYAKMKYQPLIEAKAMTLKAYNQVEIPTAGICKRSVFCKDKDYDVEVVVVPGRDRQSILEAKDAERLGLVSRSGQVKRVYTVRCEKPPAAEDKMTTERLIVKYEDVFRGLGCLAGKCSIKLK